jgi:hypothetical protein
MVIFILIFAKGRLVGTQMFCPARRFVPPDVWLPDVLSCWTFCLTGRFVPPDVLSGGRFV